MSFFITPMRLVIVQCFYLFWLVTEATERVGDKQAGTQAF